MQNRHKILDQRYNLLGQHDSFVSRLQDRYTTIYENKKGLKRTLIIVVILITLYFLITSYINYDLPWFLRREIYVAAATFILVFLFRLFHRFFGKWFIHETKRRLTVLFIREKMPRSIKFEGDRGTGKDSTNNALRKVWRDDIIYHMQEEMLVSEMIAYPYDFDQLDHYLDDHRVAFSTNSKNKFFDEFVRMMQENNCFIKKHYEKDFSADEHILELKEIINNPNTPDYEDIKYKYYNGITTQHYLSLLIRYCIHYIRLNYLDSFLISNQPKMETDTKPAKVFSTRFTNINQDDADWVWPLGGNVIIDETESDAVNPNKGAGKGNSPMKTGLRNFKAFFRHLFGELSVWINIGQKASRTEKSLRELDHAFIKVIEQSKVTGGEKRIYFLEKALSWIRFWSYKSIRNKSREKQYRRRSKVYERIARLENTGYIYVDLKVSRSDYSRMKPEQMTLKKLLAYDKAIQEDYYVKLCFHIRDCYFGYNTEYLSSLAEIKARKSKTNWNEAMTWDKDLIMKKKHLLYMAYPILDKTADIDRQKIKKEKQKAEAKRRAELIEQTRAEAETIIKQKLKQKTEKKEPTHEIQETEAK